VGSIFRYENLRHARSAAAGTFDAGLQVLSVTRIASEVFAAGWVASAAKRRPGIRANVVAWPGAGLRGVAELRHPMPEITSGGICEVEPRPVHQAHGRGVSLVNRVGPSIFEIDFKITLYSGRSEVFLRPFSLHLFNHLSPWATSRKSAVSR
jgi:hypothetical protein